MKALALRLGRWRFGKQATVVVWFVVMIVLGAGLLARHVVALPSPASAKLGPELGALRTPTEQGRWLAVHVLYDDCRCSIRIADHLVETTRPSDWSEIVLWVGAAPPAELDRRFDVRRVSADQLAHLGIEAAPSMVALDPSNHVVYSGGYTDRKQGPVIEERRILADARAARPIKTLPVFGCAVSRRLKTELSTLPTP